VIVFGRGALRIVAGFRPASGRVASRRGREGTYTGTYGYYRYRVNASSGSGPYLLGYKAP
jgi:hypothetical protein